MRSLRSSSAAAALLLSFAPAMAASAADLGPPIEAAIKVQNARWADAFRRGDYDAIGQLYSRDGELLPPGAGRVRGRVAIARYFAKAYAGTAPGSVSFSNEEFYGDDRAVTEVSDALVRAHDGRLQIHAKQTLVFLKRHGVWKLHRDMWNSY